MRVHVFSQVEKILSKETEEIKKDLKDILEKLEIGIALGMPHIRPVTGIAPGLYEIRVKDRAGQFRIIYFIRKTDAIYLLHAYRKKTRKITEKDKWIVMKRLSEVLNEKD